jgi:uncharacterized protein DUF3306
LAEPEQFLARWSRLKRRTRDGAAAPRAAAAAPELVPAEPAPNAPPAEAPALELPSIESLTKDSDYALFLRPGVSEDLRNQALRKLYESDPVFANLDGLLEYGEDFGEPFRNAGVIATAYRVLKGMPGEEEEEAAEAAGPEASELLETTVAEPRPGADQASPAADTDAASSTIDRKDETA